MACPNRTYPLKQPANWKPPVPQWQLVLPQDTASIQTLYVGVQCHDSSTSPVFQDAISAIENWLASLQNHQVIGPSVVDIFVVETGHDLPYTRVWTCYWTQQSSFDHAIALLDISPSFTNLSETAALPSVYGLNPSSPLFPASKPTTLDCMSSLGSRGSQIRNEKSTSSLPTGVQLEIASQIPPTTFSRCSARVKT